MACWCSNTELELFNSDYQFCTNCLTLVSMKGIAPEKIQVIDDHNDYYGKKYWLSTNVDFPDIYYRARLDLAERNLHWLKILLKYLLPPAKILEIGAGCGSFVGLLQHIGFDAQGIELSPWVVEYAKKTFQIPMSTGSIEELEFPEQSFDALILMDVFEHLPHPVQTLQRCLKLLKPNGILFMQLPEFQPQLSYASLLKEKSPFLSMLRPEGHLYLFSQESIKKILNYQDVMYLEFEPSIFIYDMTLVSSRFMLQTHTSEIIENKLLETPNGRFILALLDVRDRELQGIKNIESLQRQLDFGLKQQVLGYIRRKTQGVLRRIRRAG